MIQIFNVHSRGSQTSLVSDASDDNTRHLALVFFDVLILDSTPLLSSPYSARRSILESLIVPIPGRAMLSSRTPIERSGANGLARAEKELRRVFAQHIADHHEGLVLKADDSPYGSTRVPWVKVSSVSLTW